ncbi:EAL domain-containing protein [Thiorhodococcus mannitoliphagus]|uniref:EAL domain-containing protein n=1 Tax=Thiorhodococcus mannitoliphagus TaxID=329406 RepID=UPI001F0F16EE|nr:EAL domain-containing protein [Thiorhodococcus mannitoliphagus]
MDLLIEAGDQPLFLAIQRGLALVLPLIMVGALAILVRDFPSASIQQMLDAALGAQWRTRCGNLIDGTFGIASLALLCALSGTMATLHNQRHSGPHVSPIMAAVVVLSCFFVITAAGDTTTWRELFSLNRGLLVAMGVAALGSWIFLRLAQIEWLQLRFRMMGSDPVVRDILMITPAGMLTILCFGGLQWALTAAGVVDLYASTREWVESPFTDAGSGLGSGLAYVSLSQILWFFGAHGPNLLFAVEEHLLIPAGLANAAALQSGAEPAFIITKPFIDAFARLGGSGSSLCLIIAILFASRDVGSRRLAVFALFPALFNVNEPLLFGIPLILNPSYLIPFLLTPVIQTLTAFGATALELVPHTTIVMPWTTPPLISGFVATGSAAGVVMQLINLALGAIIYVPFVRFSDRVREHRGKRVMSGLLRAAESSETGVGGRKCLDRLGDEGRLAKALADDLALALKGNTQLFLEYQPQIGAKRDVVHGVEALLRWNHPVYGRVPPPVTVAIAEDMGMIDRLGAFVLAAACTQRAAWCGQVPDTLILSVNVSPRELLSPVFARTVIAVLEQSGLAPHLLELEITESTVLIPDRLALDSLRHLREMGIRIAIDDFGMGHASLRYLQELPIDTVKIDRSLTSGGPGGLNEHIVRSINELSRSLGILTIVEGVELDTQLSRFLALGCDTFQGYLFSRPLTPGDCLSFIGARQNNRQPIGAPNTCDHSVMVSRETL